MRNLRKFLRSFALFMTMNLLIQLFMPTVAWALTGGPSQPETQQFAPAGMDNMVDPFTGDFSYNIPLMDVGGYPININYSAGITPDQEASWVGLGWNLNVGAINRSHRGLPDDFAGDEIKKDYNIKPNQTFGIRYNKPIPLTKTELWGVGLRFAKTYDFFYNNYNGFGMARGANLGMSFASKNKPALGAKLGLSASVGSESGVDLQPTLGLSYKKQSNEGQFNLGTQIGFPFNSREGLKGMTLSGSFDYTSTKKVEGINEKGNKYNIKGNDGNDLVNGSGLGSNSSAFKGFAVPTYTPTLDNNSYSINLSLSFGGGTSSAVKEDLAATLTGYYSGQFLQSTSSSVPAYGYMYSGLSNSGNKLMDFNREKDGGFNKTTTNMPITNFTYDIFSASAQGLSGSYRLHRGDVGAVHDNEVRESHSNSTLGLAIHGGGPPSFKVGTDIELNYNDTYSGKWQDGNSNIARFSNENLTGVNNPNQEPVYFQKMGEMTIDSDKNFKAQSLKGFNVVHNRLESAPNVGGILSGQIHGDKDFPFVSKTKREVRAIRNTSFVTLNATEATRNHLMPINSYSKTHTFVGKSSNNNSPIASNATYGYAIDRTLPRIGEGKRANHISEIRVTNEGGARYVYGIPVYNLDQQEVSFSIAENKASSQTGIVSYNPDTDNSSNNKKGLDHFYSNTKTPPYATSYLLTAILSSDYVDSDDVPGPSQGDRGTYTKFNYTRHTDNFHWRTPYEDANYSENLLGNDKDDKANYLYGKKELWYPHSIETRTHVAEFYLSDRKDARGVANHNGGKGSVAQQQLDRVELYSLKDKENGIAEPLKTVYFDYTNELCQKTLNSVSPEKGKLTLKRIWFTYGKSKKGVLNPYVFNYSANNPDYSLLNYDRWGNYKSNAHNPTGLSNKNFPYANQNKAQADLDAAAYNLTSIHTPTGGTIKVFYESDDYAYVQNRRAMRMFRIVGVGNTLSGIGTNSLSYDNENDLIVDIGDYTNISEAQFQKDLLEGIGMAYFKVKSQILSGTDDILPGYGFLNNAECKYLGSQNGTHYAKIRLNKSSIAGRSVHPITKSTWTFARMHYGRELMGSASAEDNGVMQVVGAMVSQFTSILDLLRGFAESMISKGSGNSIDLNESFLRLNDPDKIKLGGGHRVKAIVMSDNWDLMASTQNPKTIQKQRAYYGQAYTYTTKEGNRTISSGVASFEPALGNEENPFRLPIYRTESSVGAPSKEFFLEEPFGESFFPAPAVGYSKVVVTPLKIQSSSDADLYSAIAQFPNGTTAPVITGNGTGRVEHEFYTAKDFPTITNQTGIDAKYYEPGTILKFLKYNTASGVSATQGYYIETNDMHGKQSSQKVYPEASFVNGVLTDNKPISEVHYYYKNNGQGRLSSRVPLISNDLKLIDENSPDNGDLGVTIDMVQDERSSQSLAQGGGVQMNFKYVQAAIFPIIGVVPLPTVNKESSQFRSLVTTKVVNRLGILDSTVAIDNGATISTRNLAYDAKTGQVLLTKVDNEFHDPIYNFTIPAHMAYSRMDMASANEGTFFTNLTNVNLKDGDEVATKSGIYTCVVENGVNKFYDKAGNVMPSTVKSFKVIRSGARNMQSTPIGSISLSENPIQSDKTLSFENKRILNAGATQFKEEWNRFCNCPSTTETTLNANKNTYVKGLKGNMRPFKSWTYLSNRTQTGLNKNLNIRKDGTFADFTNFWAYNTSTKKLDTISTLKDSKWQYVTEIKNYNPLGMEIENKDALGRYSMAQFGYGRNLPVATSNNSKYSSTGFDGFEDYDYKDCQDDHFGFSSLTDVKLKLSNKEAHTGRKSIKVAAGTNVQINKVMVVCEPAPEPAPVLETKPTNTKPVLRFFGPGIRGHFYAMQNVDINNAIAGGKMFEGTEFTAFESENTGTVPVYRFYHPNGAYLYTLDPDEATLSKLYGVGIGLRLKVKYKREGIAFYVFNTQVPLSKPIYRYTNRLTGSSFLSATPFTAAQANLFGFDQVGTGPYFYAY